MLVGATFGVSKLVGAAPKPPGLSHVNWYVLPPIDRGWLGPRESEMYAYAPASSIQNPSPRAMPTEDGMVIEHISSPMGGMRVHVLDARAPKW